MLSVFSPSLPPTTNIFPSITATPNCSRRPVIEVAGEDQLLVRRQNLSTVVGPLVDASIPPTMYKEPTFIRAKIRFSKEEKNGRLSHYSRFPRASPGRLEGRPPFRQQVVLKSFNDELLADAILSENGVALNVVRNELLAVKITPKLMMDIAVILIPNCPLVQVLLRCCEWLYKPPKDFSSSQPDKNK